MASIDELEASVTPVSVAENCDPCNLPGPDEKVCINCTFVGQVEKKHTFRNDVGQEEPMRYCYNFLEFVPARANFGCTMFYKGSAKE